MRADEEQDERRTQIKAIGRQAVEEEGGRRGNGTAIGYADMYVATAIFKIGTRNYSKGKN